MEIHPADSMESEEQITFDYEPLDPPNTFRTFTLLPGSSSEPVQCTINNRALDDGTPYEALSYVWGKETDRTNIVCDGKELKVPQNLSDFLFQLRSPTEARILWADSICINQNDENEKGSQIRLMRSIFQEATKVLVWIGTDSSGVAKLAFDFAYEMFHTERPEDLEQTPESWKAISTLFQQDWFRRKWCFQEIVLAKEAEFRWGEAIISWEHLGCAASRIQDKGYEELSELPSPGVHHACLAYSLGKFGTVKKDPDSPENNVTFPLLMMLTRDLEASKAYDRIFALLGIPTVDVDRDNGALFMDPNYEISKEDLYLDFAKTSIESSKSLDVLSAVYHGRHIMQKETWVPQWDVAKPSSIIPAVLGAKQFSASSHLGEFRASIKDKQLIVHGEEVDKITKTFGVTPDIQTLRSNPYLIQEIWNTIIALPPDVRPDGKSLTKAFCWTLSAGKDWRGTLVEREQDHLDDFAAFVNQDCFQKKSTPENGIAARFRKAVAPLICGCCRSRRTPKRGSSSISEAACDGNKDNGNSTRFMEAMLPMICERQLFMTSKGYLGLGPGCVQEGDLVCTLAGASVPLILRREDSGQYALVGESYVHGMMHGNAEESSTEATPPVQEFTIQ